MTNVLISGVGGQGTLLASRVLGKYALLGGYDCKMSEIHGMSQRGGSVTTHVRIGEKVYSPVVWEGGADIVLAFERLEGARVKQFLKKDGVMLVNDEKILPMPCITGVAVYPDDVKERLQAEFKNVRFVPAKTLAGQAGSEKATNIVMLGCMCKLCGLDKDLMEQAVSACVPEKFKQLNLQAFALGYDYV
jgi:indolepyruvate ferredoxin oxidoreductase beta subunit